MSAAVPPDGDEGGASVLGRIPSLGTDPPRVRLRDDDAGADPLARATAPESRYRELGEIARGGMGIVMKSRDQDLGRDVAMKLLMTDLVGRAEIVERFVEEAQIGSQLQHPGIVPVYDLGTRGGSRPYFTMKLVKGRTLAELLSGRTSPGEDARRFLGIFERVCQTMAYAHARGVVHRDLKPSNIMVGAYGEVLVVDWGLGKVLGHGGVEDERRARRRQQADVTVIETVRSGSSGSHSQSGAVLGTPPYMPPEQARGETDGLDERADVFALGAILCEVLTGQPPYDGGGVEAVRQARAADLGPAKKRLQASGAAPELISLAVVCMAPAASARPRNAAAVAKDVASFVSRVEDRAREADVAAARARAQAEADSRARRLTIVLAATIALVVLGGAAAFTWFAMDDAERAAGRTRAVETALDAAERARGAAAAAGTSAAWREVVSAARSAESTAAAGDVDPAVRSRAAEALAAALAEERSAQEREDARDRDLKDRAAIAEVADSMWMLTPDRFRSRVELLAARLGIDLAKLPAAEAAEKVRATRFAAELIPLVERVPAYTAVARAADDDPWRRQVRELRSASRWTDLRALAAETDVRRLPAESAMLLGSALRASGDAAGATLVFLALWTAHPETPLVHVALGNTAVTSAASLEAEPYETPADAFARRHAFANLACRPRSRTLWAYWGWVLLNAGDAAGAESAAREAMAREDSGSESEGRTLLLRILGRTGRHREAVAEAQEWARRCPESAPAFAYLAWALWTLNTDPDAAVANAKRATELDPKYAYGWTQLASALRAKSRFDDAVAAYRSCIEHVPDSVLAWNSLCGLLSSLGRREETIELLREMLKRFPEAPGVHSTMAMVVDPKAYGAKQQIENAREHVRLQPDAPWAHHQLAVALAAAGDAREAVLELRAAAVRDPRGTQRGSASRVLGTLVLRNAALSEAEDAVRRDPTDLLTRYWFLWALWMSGDVTRFRDEAKEAVRREPGYAWTRVMLANALLRADGDFDGADAAVRTALTFAPDAPYMQQVLALIHDSRGDPDAAVLALRRIIENNRLDESGWQQLANQLLKKRLFAKARDGYREYVSLLKAQPAPNPATVASAEQALRRFERVAALAAEYAAMRRGEYDSGDAEDLALAGNMLAAAGEPVRAVGCFERAFAKDAALAASQGNYYRERAVEAAVAAAADAAGLDAAGRAAMRRKAYDWIRAELASAETIVTAAADRDAGRREALRTGMPPAASWTAIGGVVWPSRLATLPPDEAARWRDLWRRQGILRVTLQPTDL